MIEGKRVLALTPARGGSKGLPGKNIRPLCGKPLVAWPIEIAKASKYVDQIIVSTDSDEIADVSRQYGAATSKRPDHLATDTAIVADLVRDLLLTLRESGEEFDYVVLLEATSPMRTTQMVDECIETMFKTGADSIATFSEADPPPTRLWKIEDGLASVFLENANPWLPRQQQQQAYHLNGLVYGFRVDTFLSTPGDTLFVGKGAAVVTDVLCVDIDTLEDFNLASYLIGEQSHVIE